LSRISMDKNWRLDLDFVYVRYGPQGQARSERPGHQVDAAKIRKKTG
jgi:hypothetical protein